MYPGKQWFINTIDPTNISFLMGYQAFAYFIMRDGEIMNFAAAVKESPRILEAFDDSANGDTYIEWLPSALMVNWEDRELFCAHTNERIPAAYE
jgi:hypothetical protein